MRHAGMMRHRVTPLVHSHAKGSTGGVNDTWTAQAAVWGHLKSADEQRSVGAGRYEYPTTHTLTVDGASWAVAGNRVTVGGVTFDVLGADALGEQTQLALREVTR